MHTIFSRPGSPLRFHHQWGSLAVLCWCRCEQPGCHKAPLFNFPGELRRKFCADHKMEGMVNLRLHKACLLPAALDTSMRHCSMALLAYLAIPWP